MSTPAPLPELHLQAYAYTVGHWVDRDMRNEYDLTAPYQRDSIWDLDRRRNLIKSVLMGLPIGAVCVADLGRGSQPGYRVVDGKQRIETIRLFVDNEFTVPGWWFDAEDLTDPTTRDGDVHFSDLSRGGSIHFRTRQFPAVEFRSCTETSLKPGGFGTGSNRYDHRRRSEDEMLQAEAELYLLVNFGGVAQTDTDRARAQEVADR